MGRTLMASSMVQAMDWLEDRAVDGDTVRLIWDGASRYSAQVVENRAVGLGLDVVVEVGLARVALGGTEQGIVIDLLPSVVLHKGTGDG